MLNARPIQDLSNSEILELIHTIPTSINSFQSFINFPFCTRSFNSHAQPLINILVLKNTCSTNSVHILHQKISFPTTWMAHILNATSVWMYNFRINPPYPRWPDQANQATGYGRCKLPAGADTIPPWIWDAWSNNRLHERSASKRNWNWFRMTDKNGSIPLSKQKQINKK